MEVGSTVPDFYLSSNEGYGLQGPRQCHRIKRMRGRFRDDYLAILVEPPLNGQRYGLLDGIHKVVIATRFSGESLFPIKAWPVDIHLFYVPGLDIEHRDTLDEDKMVNIAWAELYESEESARMGMP